MAVANKYTKSLVLESNRTTQSDSLEEAQARAEALFMSIGVGAIATDENGNIDRINDVALKVLGYKAEEVMGEWFPKVIKAVDENSEEIPTMNRPITKAFLTGKPVNEKARYLTRAGDQLPVSITVSPIMLRGKPVGAIEVFYDNTLEEEVDRMKSEFISIASHQLRTPLSAINTYASMLSSGYEGELNKGQQAHMQTILTAVERMNQLITTLLDVSQLEAGTLSVRAKETDITALLDRIVKELSQAASAKSINLNIDCPAKLTVRTDPLLLGEIFTNLLSNAIKYTPQKGSVKAKLRLKKDTISYCVKDTGYGIPRSMQDQVFTKFFRASNIQKTDTTGTGLGLYMVKQIADVMGGHLKFESRENKGSEFFFTLPLNSANSN